MSDDENRLTWDHLWAVEAERDSLRRVVQAVRDECSSFGAHTFTVDGRLVVEVSAILAALAAAADAPQPEHPEQPHEFTPTPRLVSDRCYCGESRYSPLHRPAQPADPPTKCDHGLTEPHDYHRPFSNGTRETIHCPGPSPAQPADLPTSTHTRPTPQADRRRAELERLGVLHPDTADQPPDLTPQQRYEWARREGKSETEARAEGWPGVTFCGHTAEEGCTGHGDF